MRGRAPTPGRLRRCARHGGIAGIVDQLPAGTPAGSMMSSVEFEHDDAMHAIGLVAHYLEHGAVLIEQVRTAREVSRVRGKV